MGSQRRERIRCLRTAVWAALPGGGALALLLLGGCGANNPFLGPQGPAGAQAWPGGAAGGAPWTAQVQDLDRRAQALDANNSELHRQLALAQQQAQLYSEETSLLRRQLTETTARLQELQTAKTESEQRLQAVLASAQQRGGAWITANNSLRTSLTPASVPGLEVKLDGDVVRIVVPGDQLFRPGTAQLLPTAYAVLDQAASAVAQNYPRQRIGVEGHTDSSPLGGADPSARHRLSAAQAMAVFEQLTLRNRLPSRQLFVLAQGDNHPLASNATAAGQARNRRLELVVYPETMD